MAQPSVTAGDIPTTIYISTTISGKATVLPAIQSTTTLSNGGGISISTIVQKSSAASSSHLSLSQTAHSEAAPSSNQSSTASVSSLSKTQTTQTDLNTASSDAPSSSTSVDPPTGSVRSSAGVSTGAAAGIGIGCALAGLFIGVIVAFFLLRRRKKAQPEEKHSTTVVADHKGALAAQQNRSNVLQLPQFLLDASPDKDIARELQSLGSLIHQHVESQYYLGPTSANANSLSRSLLSLGFREHGSSLNVDSIAALCIDPRSRQIGLRHVISQVIFRSIDFHSRSHLSMFPAPVAAFIQSIPGGGLDAEDYRATSLALSQWRSLSAFLLHPNRTERTALPMAEAMATPQALSVAGALNTFLHFFLAPNEDSRHEQTHHLQAVVLECTRFGYVLFSQPSDWRVVFEEDSAAAGRHMVVVCPGLEKLSNGDGTPYTSPRRIMAPVVEQVS